MALLQDIYFTSPKNVYFSKREVKNKGRGIFIILWRNFDILNVPLIKIDGKSIFLASIRKWMPKEGDFGISILKDFRHPNLEL